MQQLKKLEEIVSTWPGISAHTHRFGGREFRLGSAEVGHVHECGIVDIPLPRGIRDALLARGQVEEHRWVPNSGWATFFVRNDKDLQHAIWLMRLSYFRYALKTAADARGLFAEARKELQLSAPFDALLEEFVPAAKQAAASA
jgi:hypothetical protein